MEILHLSLSFSLYFVIFFFLKNTQSLFRSFNVSCTLIAKWMEKKEPLKKKIQKPICMAYGVRTVISTILFWTRPWCQFSVSQEEVRRVAGEVWPPSAELQGLSGAGSMVAGSQTVNLIQPIKLSTTSVSIFFKKSFCFISAHNYIYIIYIFCRKVLLPHD